MIPGLIKTNQWFSHCAHINMKLHVPHKRIAFVWEHPDFHDLSKGREGLSHQLFWASEQKHPKSNDGMRTWDMCSHTNVWFLLSVKITCRSKIHLVSTLHYWKQTAPHIICHHSQQTIWQYYYCSCTSLIALIWCSPLTSQRAKSVFPTCQSWADSTTVHSAVTGTGLTQYFIKG